jgi:hypothetical protein
MNRLSHFALDFFLNHIKTKEEESRLPRRVCWEKYSSMNKITYHPID